MTIERCIDALVVAGLADWADESGVAWIARSVGGAPSGAESRRLGLRLVREVLDRGLTEIGDLSGPGGRFRRCDVPSWAALEELARTWIDSEDDSAIGDFFWLANTAAGDRRGEAVPEKE